MHVIKLGGLRWEGEGLVAARRRCAPLRGEGGMRCAVRALLTARRLFLSLRVLCVVFACVVSGGIMTPMRKNEMSTATRPRDDKTKQTRAAQGALQQGECARPRHKAGRKTKGDTSLSPLSIQFDSKIVSNSLD